ncbi:MULTISPECIES: hypothetical protein [Helicobacter]|uniref:Periplasmic protein n=1 Tax=Helicobacter typhlonius TaxID=76936 RepID=A0A099UGK3_9HELI|nr:MULTISPECIES: hypothetical protein [Helicobacter]TLD78629.1 hypothetical protein LS75_004775 [Helicobacter typhlonius]TLD89381.1 hypothetical protein LS67_002800 [Helicobacter sp. MIT 03-1616]CUU40112.1 FIG00713102: Hypothetical protein [Helicobacter typhlonius]HCD73644.1 hypothetical protein [Helicobacter sp.]
MKKLVFVAVLVAVIGAAIYGVLYLDKISVAPAFEAKPMELPQVGGEIEHKEENWLGFVPDNDELPYAYPATELSIRFDFLAPDAKRTIPSAISIDDLDEYKFACVKQVLAQNNIESAYYKSGNVLKLMVFVSDEAMYEKLLADLKYYRLQFSVQ